jgi:hypothetical protein
MLQDSGYLTAKRRVLMPVGKENAQPNRRIRKALAPSWSTPGNISVPGVTDISYSGETPVWVAFTEYSVLSFYRFSREWRKQSMNVGKREIRKTTFF